MTADTRLDHPPQLPEKGLGREEGKLRPTSQGCQGPSRNPSPTAPSVCSPLRGSVSPALCVAWGSPLPSLGLHVLFWTLSQGPWPGWNGPPTPGPPGACCPGQSRARGALWGEEGEWEAWGLSHLDSPLILSKDASPQARGRLGPDIKGPPVLALSREPHKVTGNRRMTLCPA